MKKKVIFIFTFICCLFLISGCSYSDFTGKKDNKNNYNNNYKNNYEDTKNDKNNDKPKYEDLTVSKDVQKTVEGSYNDDSIKANITINDVYWTTKLTPPNPTQSYYSYYEAEEGQVYQIVEMKVENIGSESFSEYIFEGFLSDTCTPTFIYNDNYKYTGIFMLQLEKDNKGKYDLGSFYSLEPLETKTLYAVNKVPENIKNMNLSVNLCFGDNKLNIDW